MILDLITIFGEGGERERGKCFKFVSVLINNETNKRNNSFRQS